jgi:hypothetical protein
MGSGRIRHKLGPQPSNLVHKPFLQGTKAGDLEGRYLGSNRSST